MIRIQILNNKKATANISGMVIEVAREHTKKINF